jgi:hypothetical protein
MQLSGILPTGRGIVETAQRFFWRESSTELSECIFKKVTQNSKSGAEKTRFPKSYRVLQIIYFSLSKHLSEADLRFP